MKQNIKNGGKRDGQIDLIYLLQLRDLEIDIIGLPETNLNWRNLCIRTRWEIVVKSVWTRERVFYSSINSCDNEDVYRKGGVCTIVTCKWASFFETTKQDNIVRWVEIIFKGQIETLVTLITS